jgi:hypothetical protein
MLKFTVHQMKDFSFNDTKKYKSSVRLLEEAINSKEFYKLFMELELSSDKGMTNQQIYDLMMSGAEVLDPIVDNEADIFITMYYSNNSTVGYTYPHTKEKWINKKFFDEYDASQIAKNLIHEYMHKLGFGHVSSREHTSVPYAVGFLIEDLVKNILKKISVDQGYPHIPREWEKRRVKVCSRSWRSLWLRKYCKYTDKFIFVGEV